MRTRNSTDRHFTRINTTKESDLIIQQIQSLIHGGILKPGDRLPSEKALEERIGLGRSHIRQALRKLETYGVVETIPQSGTYISRLWMGLLEGIIANVLKCQQEDYDSLIEVRSVLETYAARLAAERGQQGEVNELASIHAEFKKQVTAGQRGLEENHLFHLKIAGMSGSSVLISILSMLSSQILRAALNKPSPTSEEMQKVLRDHERIMAAIRSKNSTDAETAMRDHMTLYKAFEATAHTDSRD